MSKKALIIHGFEVFDEKHPIVKSLKAKGYDVAYPEYFFFSQRFKIDKLVSKIANENKDIDLLIGISLGGLISGRLISRIKPKKIILIASGPKFSPKERRIKFLLKVPSFIIFCLILLGRRIVINDKNLKIVFNHELLNLLSSKYLFSLYKYAKHEDVTRQYQKYTGKLLALSGDRDQLMPVDNFKEISNCKVFTVSATHENVINTKTLKTLESII